MGIAEENKYYFLRCINYYQLGELKNKNKFFNVFSKYNKNKTRKYNDNLLTKKLLKSQRGLR